MTFDLRGIVYICPDVIFVRGVKCEPGLVVERKRLSLHHLEMQLQTQLAISADSRGNLALPGRYHTDPENPRPQSTFAPCHPAIRSDS